jgi:hypothetical protein
MSQDNDGDVFDSIASVLRVTASAIRSNAGVIALLVTIFGTSVSFFNIGPERLTNAAIFVAVSPATDTLLLLALLVVVVEGRLNDDVARTDGGDSEEESLLLFVLMGLYGFIGLIITQAALGDQWAIGGFLFGVAFYLYFIVDD